MRLTYVLLMAAATLLARCDAATAATNDLSQMDQIPSVGVVPNGIPIKRLLRTAGDNDDEERGIEVFTKMMPMKKLVSKDGKRFSGSFVKKLLKNEAYRKKTFEYWSNANIDGNSLRQSLGNLDKKGRVELLNRYTAFVGAPNGLVYHRPGPL